MAGFDYLGFLKNYGTGSRGAGGFYSNMNRSMPGLGNAMQQSQKAGGLKFMASGLNQFGQGNVKEGIKSGIGYALNQNPYIAGINMFNDITGGIRFDKMLGFGPKKPQLTKAQRDVDANFAQQMADDRNAYLKQSNEAADQAQRYNEYVNAQRNILRDLQQNGMSARSLAPMLGQFANLNEQAAGAARSNVASNLSQRGLSPSSGIGVGAMTGVENALGAQQAQQRATIANQVMQDVSQFRNQMTAQDAAAADKAYARSTDLRDSAAMLPIRQAMLEMEQQKLNQARDQQMYMRRQGETEALGGFVGKMFPYIYDEYRRGLDRNKDGDGFTPIRDTGVPGTNYGTDKNNDPSTHYFERNGRMVFKDPFSGRLYDANSGEEVEPDLTGPDAPYTYIPEGTTVRPGTATGSYGQGTVTTSPGEIFPTFGEDPELMAAQQAMDAMRFPQQNYGQNYTKPVSPQTMVELDLKHPQIFGRPVFHKGQYFMYTPSGWMKQ